MLEAPLAPLGSGLDSRRTVSAAFSELSAPHRQCSAVPKSSRSAPNTAYGRNHELCSSRKTLNASDSRNVPRTFGSFKHRRAMESFTRTVAS